MCNVGVWKDRDEMANPLQKHDVELIKDDKRYSFQFPVPGNSRSLLLLQTGWSWRVRFECMWMNS